MQPADHDPRQRALAVQNLLDAVALADDRLEILDGHAALIHPELDGFHWIRRGDGHVLGLVRLLFLVGADELDVDDLQLVREGHDSDRRAWSPRR